MNIPVIYEDDWLLIVDKPAGLITIPTPKNESRTLTSILNDDAKQKNSSYRLHPCHRLDKETSGLIIYAKGKSIQKRMMDLFRARKIRKTYFAFIQGHLARDYGEIKIPIRGQSALTLYKSIGRKKEFSILEVQPISGRTNQIRIHLKQIGHPILGERKFAFRKDFKLKTKRLCLHAEKLEFEHPVTKKYLRIQTELPLGMRDLLA